MAGSNSRIAARSWADTDPVRSACCVSSSCVASEPACPVGVGLDPEAFGLSPDRLIQDHVVWSQDKPGADQPRVVDDRYVQRAGLERCFAQARVGIGLPLVLETERCWLRQVVDGRAELE